MAAIPTNTVVLIALTGLISVLLLYWIHVSGGLGLNMLREWLCLSFSRPNGDDGRAADWEIPEAVGATQGELDGSQPSGDHTYKDWEPEGIILNEAPYERPPASRAFYPVLFTVLTLCLVGLMAGIAIPVKGFIDGRMQSRALKGELADMQKAVDLLMTEYGLESFPDPGPGASGALRKDSADATGDMSVFPYMDSGNYALWDLPTVDFLPYQTEALYYVDVSGVVHQVVPEG